MPHITTTALESPHLATEICFRRYPAGPPCLNRTKSMKLKNWAESSQSNALTRNGKRFVILKTTELNLQQDIACHLWLELFPVLDELLFGPKAP